MKRWLPFLMLIPVLGWGANEDSRPIGADSVRSLRKQVDAHSVIYFSTTIPANTEVVILGDHWATGTSTQPLVWPTAITFSTQPAKSNGGRTYATFQFLNGAGTPALNQNDNQRLHWSLGTAVGTSTSPYLRVGEWWPPADWPVVYQSTVTVRSTATATIAGYIITEKSRR